MNDVMDMVPGIPEGALLTMRFMEEYFGDSALEDLQTAYEQTALVKATLEAELQATEADLQTTEEKIRLEERHQRVLQVVSAVKSICRLQPITGSTARQDRDRLMARVGLVKARIRVLEEFEGRVDHMTSEIQRYLAFRDEWAEVKADVLEALEVLENGTIDADEEVDTDAVAELIRKVRGI